MKMAEMYEVLISILFKALSLCSTFWCGLHLDSFKHLLNIQVKYIECVNSKYK